MSAGMRGMCLAGAVFGGSQVLATPDVEDEVWKGVFSSFSAPLGQFLDDSAEESLNYRLAFDQPADRAKSTSPGAGTQGAPAKSPTLQFGLKYVPLTSWFLNVNFFRYLSPESQKPWNPDFTYSFGYDDWHPYTFSLQYSNNGGKACS
jgi:hypothetical protein